MEALPVGPRAWPRRLGTPSRPSGEDRGWGPGGGEGLTSLSHRLLAVHAEDLQLLCQLLDGHGHGDPGGATGPPSSDRGQETHGRRMSRTRSLWSFRPLGD